MKYVWIKVKLLVGFMLVAALVSTVALGGFCGTNGRADAMAKWVMCLVMAFAIALTVAFGGFVIGRVACAIRELTIQHARKARGAHACGARAGRRGGEGGRL